MQFSRMNKRLMLIAFGTIIVAVFVFFGLTGFSRQLPLPALLSIEPTRTPTPSLVRTNTPVPTKTNTPTSGPINIPLGMSLQFSCAGILSLSGNTLSCAQASGPSPTLTTVPPTVVPLATATSRPNTPIPTAVGTASPLATNTVLPSTVTVLPTATPTRALTATSIVATGPTWYVSKSGNNTDGRTLNTAWNELNQINWSAIQPGDTVLLEGGTYTTTLLPTKSGTAAKPITVKATGPVTIFGGRLTPLPYCQQVTYTYQTVGVRQHGIDFGGASYVTVDGSAWRGIIITGHNDSGVSLGGSFNTLRYAEIYDNGQANFANGSWRPDRPGVSTSGSNNKLDHNIIHDNGQDAIQTGSQVTNMSITNDWHYNARIHPQYGDAVPWNYCMHSDGFQIYAGGTSSNISFSDTILGPGFMQGTILGQSPARAQVNNVSFSNVLVIGDFNAGIMGYATTNPTGWTIDHTTIYTARSPNWNASPGSVVGTGWNESLILDGSGHRVTNSIVFDGRVVASGITYSGNCEWAPYGNNNLLSGTLGGIKAPPQFLSPPPLTVPDATLGNTSTVPTSPTMQQLIDADYTIGGGSPCAGKGSSLTSVAELLSR